MEEVTAKVKSSLGTKQMDGIRSKVAAGYELGTRTGARDGERSGIRLVPGTTRRRNISMV